MAVRIIDMPDDPALQQLVASTSVELWRRDFPLDTEDWYFNLYSESQSHGTLPVVLVALDGDQFVGTASLIADDELPDAPEPGPWVAAVYVADSHRRRGIGTALLDELRHRAVQAGHGQLFLYTADKMAWYETMGWHRLRTSQLNGHDVTVMSSVL
jgi:GNAT superfamily N-acetyltransferase